MRVRTRQNVVEAEQKVRWSRAAALESTVETIPMQYSKIDAH